MCAIMAAANVHVKPHARPIRNAPIDPSILETGQESWQFGTLAHDTGTPSMILSRQISALVSITDLVHDERESYEYSICRLYR